MTPDQEKLIKVIDENNALQDIIANLLTAQTCVSCKSGVCPPMRCESCIEKEEPAPGMPARPVTAAFREHLKSVLAAFTVYVNIPTEKSWLAIADAVVEASKILGECPVPHPKG